MSLGANTGRRARKSERVTASAMGGRTQPASGAMWHSKADIKTPEYLVEQKDTDAGSYRLTLDDLIKLRGQAALEGKIPVFSVVFNFGGQRRQYMIVPFEHFGSNGEPG